MLTWKTAIGIAVRSESKAQAPDGAGETPDGAGELEFVCVKRGLNGVRESGRMTLSDFRNHRPEEAGAAYREFLRSQGLSAANAVVALPRRDVLLRTIVLPAEAARALDKAVEYQVDGLHPFEEGGVDYAYSVIGHAEKGEPLHVAVVMIEKGIAASYYDWFSQAGIPISGFTTSAAVLYGLALESAPVYVISKRGQTAEILAVSSAVSNNVSLLSKEVHVGALDRELQLCRSEMRLADEAEVRTIEQPDVAYAAGLSALITRPFSINLLPEARRVYESPWTHALTYALAGACALLILGMLARPLVQDYLYLRRINREIRALEPRVKYAQKLESKGGRELTRIMELRSMRERTATRLQTLAELTRLLPPTASLLTSDIDDDGLVFSGTADSASGLLTVLGTSPLFRNPEFVAPINKNSEGKEQFRIRMQMAARAVPAVDAGLSAPLNSEVKK
jgi:Tfp pilus assembly protein PilN